MAASYYKATKFTGMIMMHNYLRIGVVADLPYGWIDKCLNFGDYFLTGVTEYQKLITRNLIFLELVESVDIIGRDKVIKPINAQAPL